MSPRPFSLVRFLATFSLVAPLAPILVACVHEALLVAPWEPHAGPVAYLTGGLTGLLVGYVVAFVPATLTGLFCAYVSPRVASMAGWLRLCVLVGVTASAPIAMVVDWRWGTVMLSGLAASVIGGFLTRNRRPSWEAAGITPAGSASPP